MDLHADYLRAWIENVLKFDGEPDLSSVEIRNIHQLRSGDLIVHTASYALAQALRDHPEIFTGRFRSAIPMRPSHHVLIRGIAPFSQSR